MAASKDNARPDRGKDRDADQPRAGTEAGDSDEDEADEDDEDDEDDAGGWPRGLVAVGGRLDADTLTRTSPCGRPTRGRSSICRRFDPHAACARASSGPAGRSPSIAISRGSCGPA